MLVNRAKNILLNLMPELVIAGRYATNVQENVGSQIDKTSNGKTIDDTAFTAALTDADLSIQNFVEVLLLGKDENQDNTDISFYGEEDASSLNSKYFSKDKDIKITLDPIDGTLFYKNKLPYFSIILTACSNTEMLAALIYQPVLNQCFFSVKNAGAYKLTSSDMLTKTIGSPYSLSESSDKTVLMYKCLDFKNIISKEYNCLELSTDFDYSTDWKYDFASILNSNISAVVTSYPLLIDSGAIAFTVREAGGFVSDFKGELLVHETAIDNLKYDSLIMSVNEKVGLELIELINL